MPPKEIFIVRHSERADKKDWGYSLRTTRPHDAPLTDNGIRMAETLGQYLRSHYGVNPDNVVVLSSPLLRCVQTSAGIIRGMRGELLADVAPPAAAATEASGGKQPPLYIEPCLVESAAWQFVDLRRNPAVAREGFIQCPDPLWLPASEMQATVSPHVRLERPYTLGAHPDIRVVGDKLVEPDFEGRCKLAAQAMISSENPTFANKTVICVSHGEASVVWFDYVTGDPASIDASEVPAYTAFMHVTPVTDGEGEVVRWVAQLPAFSTPHLPEKPSEC